MEKVKSCSVIYFTKTKQPSFLLMKRSYRYDLPKGHIEPGETDLQCALRELFEETGITNRQVRGKLDFRFKTIYYPRYRHFSRQKVEKSLVIFFCWVSEELEIVMTEHSDSEWVKWNPPHFFHNRIIDELLVAVGKELPLKQYSEISKAIMYTIMSRYIHF
ncbi:MAG: NUDIX domain-containing protein [Cyanobacteria bacterium P01_G01_bin.39]